MGLLEAAGPPPRAPGPLPTRQFKQLWSGLLGAVAARKIPSRSPSAQPWFPRAAHTSGSTKVTLDPTGSAGHPPGEPERPLQLLETEAARSALGVQSPRASAPTRAPSCPARRSGRALLSQSGGTPELRGLALPALALSPDCWQAPLSFPRKPRPPPECRGKDPTKQGDCFHAEVSAKASE